MNPKMYEGPGLSVPPPVLYLVSLLIGIGLNDLWPLSTVPGWWGAISGMAFLMAALMIVVPVLLRFRRAGTPFDVRKAASVLIVDGPFRFSRHPSYVSLTVLYVGLGLLLNNGWGLLLLIPLLFGMDQWIVRKVEHHLEAKFGQEYRRYKATVRRWL